MASFKNPGIPEVNLAYVETSSQPQFSSVHYLRFSSLLKFSCNSPKMSYKASVTPPDQKKIKSECKHPFEEDLFSWTFDLLDNNFWNLKVIVRGQKRPKFDQKSSKVGQKSPKDQKSLSVDAP